MYWTASKGIGGRIKQRPEDFIVEEIKDGRVWKIGYSPLERISDLFVRGDGEHVHATLVKRDRNTLDVLREIAKKLGIDVKYLGYAGLKDKRALTAQRISIPRKYFRKVRLRDAFLKNLSCEKRKIRIGSLAGNRFTVIIRGIRRREPLFEFMRYEKLPNLFGEQRFGGNEIMGLKLLRREVKRKGSPMERMYIDAYQAWVFNRVLNELGWDAPKYIALPGYKRWDEYTLEELRKDGVKLEDFRRFKARGDWRRSFFKPRWLGYRFLNEDLLLKFELPKGSYATILLRELMKSG